MARRKEHKVEIIVRNVRYVARDDGGNISLYRDGDPAGGAQWRHDQLVNSTATLPDDVYEALEKLLKERFDANWDE